MGPAVRVAALLAAAVVAAAQPLTQQFGEQADTATTQGMVSTTPAEATAQGQLSTTPDQATAQGLPSTTPDQATAQGLPSTTPDQATAQGMMSTPRDNKRRATLPTELEVMINLAGDVARLSSELHRNESEEVPPALVEKVKTVVVVALRMALEWHHSGGARLVTAKQLNVSGAPSLLITLHRSAASLEPKAQLASRLAVPSSGEDVVARAADDPSAEASPLPIEPLAPPVVPRVVPIALPLAYAGDGGSNVVVGNEVPHNEAHGSPTDETATEGRMPKKVREISQRSAEVDKATQMVVALVSEGDGSSGLGLLSRFVKEFKRAVDAVKKLMTRWGGFRAGGGGRRPDVKGRHVPASEDRVANLLEAGEHARGANHTEVPGH